MTAEHVATRSICVLGTGHIGMASMLGLAELGWAVRGYDPSVERIRKLRSGTAVFQEPGLTEKLREHLANGRLMLSASLEASVRDAEVIVVAADTRARDDGSADLTALLDIIDSLSRLNLVSWPAVVVRSTVPPGTCDRLAERVELWGELVFAPAFLREGSALHDFLHPDRIVIGSDNTDAAVPYLTLFEALGKPLLLTSRSSAELIECGSHAFLALKTSFANEISELCDAIGATSDDVLRGIGYDARIGAQFLRPDLGFGEPRLEKDVRSIAYVAGLHEIGHEVASATLRVNSAQPRRIVELVERLVGPLEGLTIGIWGLALETESADARDTRAMPVVDLLAGRGAAITAYDPSVRVVRLPRGCRLVPSALDAANADVLFVLSDWPEFRSIAPQSYAPLIRRRLVIDGRNALDAERVVCAGLTYRGLGRAASSTSAPPLPGARPIGIAR